MEIAAETSIATLGISNGVDHMIAEDVSNLNNINTVLFVPFQIEHDVAVTNVEASETVAKEGSTVDVTIVAKNQGLFDGNFQRDRLCNSHQLNSNLFRSFLVHV